MSLYLHNNDKQTGPYTDEQVRQMLQSGLVNSNTLAWREGMANWEPLQKVLVSAGLPVTSIPAAPAPSKPVLGIISLVVSLLFLPGWIVLLVMAGMAHNNGTADPQFNMIVGLIFLGGVFFNFLAMVLGVIGAFTSRSKTIAIVGACINGFTLVALVGLMLLGLAVSHKS